MLKNKKCPFCRYDLLEEDSVWNVDDWLKGDAKFSEDIEIQIRGREILNTAVSTEQFTNFISNEEDPINFTDDNNSSISHSIQFIELTPETQQNYLRRRVGRLAFRTIFQLLNNNSSIHLI